MLNGNNGILSQAQNAKNKTIEGEAKEAIALAYTAAMTDKYVNNNSDFSDAMKSELDNNGYTNVSVVGGQDGGYSVTLDGKEYILSNDGTVTAKDENNGNSADSNNITIPAGFTKTEDSANDVKDGIVVKDDQDNEFVWVPVPNVVLDLSSTYSSLTEAQIKEKVQEQINNGNYPMAIKINTTNYIGVLYNFTKSGDEIQITPYTSWTPKCESYTGWREPAYLSNTTYGDASTTTGRGINLLKTILDFSGTDDEIKTAWTNQMQNEFDEMVEKIDSKKGFWVGRYEMGRTVEKSTSKPGVALNASSSSANTWYGLYKAGKNYKGNTNYKSTMIWGSQYDQMMIWMTQNGIDVTSSTVANGGTKNTDSTKTGAQSTDIINNVYDIYGGRWEWTLEAYNTDHRVIRGGNYHYSSSPASRTYGSPFGTSTFYGSRLTLY